MKKLRELNVIWEQLRQGRNHGDLVLNKNLGVEPADSPDDDGGDIIDFSDFFDRDFVESFVTDRDNFNRNVAALLAHSQMQ
jgi:hypothetical protein